MCLLRGTDWIFIYNSGYLVLYDSSEACGTERFLYCRCSVVSQLSVVMTPTRPETCVVGGFTLRYGYPRASLHNSLLQVLLLLLLLLLCTNRYHRTVTVQPHSIKHVSILNFPGTKQNSGGGCVCHRPIGKMHRVLSPAISRVVCGTVCNVLIRRTVVHCSVVHCALVTTHTHTARYT